MSLSGVFNLAFYRNAGSEPLSPGVGHVAEERGKTFHLRASTPGQKFTKGNHNCYSISLSQFSVLSLCLSRFFLYFFFSPFIVFHFDVFCVLIVFHSPFLSF